MNLRLKLEENIILRVLYLIFFQLGKYKYTQYSIYGKEKQLNRLIQELKNNLRQRKKRLQTKQFKKINPTSRDYMLLYGIAVGLFQ